MRHPRNPAPEPKIRRWPAEWEPAAAVWVATPHNPETWPGCLTEAQDQHAAWCDAMAEAAPVRRLEDLGIVTNDAWVRDYGPLFVWETQPEPRLVVHDFRFDGWGKKYETRDLDDAAAGRLAVALRLPHVRHGHVLEGGAIDTDGRGTLLTTTNCLLDAARGVHADRDTLERRFAETLGIDLTVWLTLPGDLLPGDDTDGHVDNAARFLAPGLVAVHPGVDPAPLRAAGREVLELPRPEPIIYDFPADRFGPAARTALPASYANFVMLNGRLFVPAFGQPADDTACRLLDDALPTHSVVPVRSEHLLVGLGNLHCLCMTQPADPAG
ncbi:MAG: agmatine deiminase family protein [Planctomycetota bacterium]